MPNFDEKTGIRYGVISPHSISGFALDDIYTNGTDPQYEESKTELKTLIDNLFDHIGFISEDKEEDLRDELEQLFNDNYQNDGSGIMDYSDKDYDLHASGDNFGIFVMRSPYYTYCRGCSPCAPGAGDLDAPLNPDEMTIMDNGRDKALCLGPEWFDKDNDQYARKIPYRVFRISDDTEVLPE